MLDVQMANLKIVHVISNSNTMMPPTTRSPWVGGDKTPSPPSSVQLYLPPRAPQPPCSSQTLTKTLPGASPLITAPDNRNYLALSAQVPSPDFDTVIGRVVEFLKDQLYRDLVIYNVTAQTATQVIQYFNCPTKVRSTYLGLPAKSLERFR